jgi:hypothetical protein
MVPSVPVAAYPEYDAHEYDEDGQDRENDGKCVHYLWRARMSGTNSISRPAGDW